MRYDSVMAPAGVAFAISPADNASIRATALYVGGAGDLHVLMEDESEVTFIGVPAGSILPIRVLRVFSTSTSATDIIGLTP